MIETPIISCDSFPTFQRMQSDMMIHKTPLLTYMIAGRRLTIITDPNLFDIVFHPDEYGEREGVGDAVKMEMDKISHAWFQIPKDMCHKTRDGLNAVRKELQPSKAVNMNAQIANDITDS